MRIITSLQFTSLIRRFATKRYASGKETELFGIVFPHPVGLGSGIERDASCVNSWQDLGFSFVEVGPLTVSPQACQREASGRRIRTARGKDTRDINPGVMRAIKNLGKRRPGTIVAGNLLYSRDSDPAQAAVDYKHSFALLYEFVDYFVVPANRPGQPADDVDIPYLDATVSPLLDFRIGMDVIKPVVLKLMTRVSEADLEAVVDYSLRNGVDALSVDASQVRIAVALAGTRMPIIAHSARSAAHSAEALSQGAALVEVGASLALEGFSIVRKILKRI